MLTLQQFKLCPLQNIPLYSRYTVLNVSSIVWMLRATHFLRWRAVLLSHFPQSPLWFGIYVISKWFWMWKAGKILLSLSPENRVDGAERVSDVLPGKCRWVATRVPAHCHGAISNFGFPTIQDTSCPQRYSNALIFPGTTVCLPFDYVLQIHDGQCLSNQEKQPTTPWSMTESSMLFWSRRPFPHPLRWMHFGFNIIHISPWLLPCYDILKNVFFTICFGKKFLTDFNTILFLIVRQNSRQKLSTGVTHLNFFSTNLVTWFHADVKFVCKLSES